MVTHGSGEIVWPRSRGRPAIRWKNSVKEYMYEIVAHREGGNELARRDCLDRERCSCHSHSLGKPFQRE